MQQQAWVRFPLFQFVELVNCDLSSDTLINILYRVFDSVRRPESDEIGVNYDEFVSNNGNCLRIDVNNQRIYDWEQLAMECGVWDSRRGAVNTILITIAPPPSGRLDVHQPKRKTLLDTFLMM